MKITASAPCRISLFGGGSDLDVFSSQFGGVVINCAITLYQHITLSTGTDATPLENHFPDGSTPDFLLKMLRLFNDEPVSVSSTSDAHLGSGLGSSAAAAAALLKAITKAQNRHLSREDLAQAAYLAETDMGWFGGKQDQFASSYGGVNVMEFDRGRVRVNPLAPPFVDWLQDAIVLYYFGKRSTAHPQEHMGELTTKQLEALKQAKEFAVGSLDYLVKGDYQKLGELLDLAWKQKKISHPHATTPEIDAIYTHALAAGAFGGKICGAGSGGYGFFFIDPHTRAPFIASMRRVGLSPIDFDLDWNGAKARIIKE